MDKIDLTYYQTVVDTQDDAVILKSELQDLIDEVNDLKYEIKTWDVKKPQNDIEAAGCYYANKINNMITFKNNT